MSSFVKLGLINSEPCPSLQPTSSPVSWVRTLTAAHRCSSLFFYSLSLFSLYEMSCLAPPRKSVELWEWIYLKGLLLSIAAYLHQGFTETRRSDIDESTVGNVYRLLSSLRWIREHWATCSEIKDGAKFSKPFPSCFTLFFFSLGKTFTNNLTNNGPHLIFGPEEKAVFTTLILEYNHDERNKVKIQTITTSRSRTET